jgi:CheY-like chemotaxis protein
LGVGTALRLYLPRAAGSEAAARRTILAEQPAAVTANSALIMIVDDDPDVRAALVEGVAALGYRVTEAASGRDALERISAGEAVDLVLTDYLMPHGLTGRDLAHRIAALGRGIRLVLISGNLPPDEEAGELTILHKPVRLAELGRVISDVLGH